MSEPFDLATRRQPVSYTVTITQYWDGRIQGYVDGVSDSPRSQRAVADAMDRLCAHWDTMASERQGPPAPNDAVNTLGRITEELGLPWNATASRILEVLRGRT